MAGQGFECVEVIIPKCLAFG